MIQIKGFNSRYLVKGNNDHTLIFFTENGESYKIVEDDQKFLKMNLCQLKNKEKVKKQDQQKKYKA